jgi:DNA invertase Pin-like site-specific DNA recombinase
MSAVFNVLPEGDYIAYLRKSRADVEDESDGAMETLTKHRKALMQLAKHHKVNITHIFEEIASGESIFHRPEMLKLLELVESGTIKGVLVMDIDRLGRGNMQEQGLILTKFKENKVLIITPRKIYDLNNEFDEEYTEFETFMARKELKIITRRMQSGRDRYAAEGNFISGVPPFGYRAVYNERGDRYLEVYPERAEIVKMIFQWYIDGIGAHLIARRLQEMQIQTTKNSKWGRITILQMLKNEVYIGRIQQHKCKTRKSSDGKTKYSRIPKNREEWIDVEGKHPAIIDKEIFAKVKSILESRRPPIKSGYTLRNPFAGLIVCGKCGYRMTLKQDLRNINVPRYRLCCDSEHCDNCTARIGIVEERVLQAIEMYIQNLSVSVMPKERKSKAKSLENTIRIAQGTFRQLEEQKLKQFDLLEQGIYDKDTFLERSKNISVKILETTTIINTAKKELEEEQKINTLRKEVIPMTHNILNLYRSTSDVVKKNQLMKQVLEKVVFTKEKKTKPDEFTIDITPKIT